jgi:hypothetical protein
LSGQVSGFEPSPDSLREASAELHEIRLRLRRQHRRRLRTLVHVAVWPTVIVLGMVATLTNDEASVFERVWGAFVWLFFAGGIFAVSQTFRTRVQRLGSLAEEKRLLTHQSSLLAARLSRAPLAGDGRGAVSLAEAEAQGGALSLAQQSGALSLEAPLHDPAHAGLPPLGRRERLRLVAQLTPVHLTIAKIALPAVLLFGVLVGVAVGVDGLFLAIVGLMVGTIATLTLTFPALLASLALRAELVALRPERGADGTLTVRFWPPRHSLSRETPTLTLPADAGLPSEGVLRGLLGVSDDRLLYAVELADGRWLTEQKARAD